jgi:hypothetical protein
MLLRTAIADSHPNGVPAGLFFRIEFCVLDADYSRPSVVLHAFLFHSYKIMLTSSHIFDIVIFRRTCQEFRVITGRLKRALRMVVDRFLSAIKQPDIELISAQCHLCYSLHLA